MQLSSGIKNYVPQPPAAVKRAAQLQRAWENIAPEVVLAHTDYVAKSNRSEHSLVVYVDNSQWCAQLAMNKEFYRQSFEYELDQKVDEVFFVVSRESGRHEIFHKHDDEKPWYIDDTTPQELTPEELQFVESVVAGIKDPTLKETLQNAFISDLEWKKGVKLQKQP